MSLNSSHSFSPPPPPFTLLCSLTRSPPHMFPLSIVHFSLSSPLTPSLSHSLLRSFFLTLLHSLTHTLLLSLTHPALVLPAPHTLSFSLTLPPLTPPVTHCLGVSLSHSFSNSLVLSVSSSPSHSLLLCLSFMPSTDSPPFTSRSHPRCLYHSFFHLPLTPSLSHTHLSLTHFSLTHIAPHYYSFPLALSRFLSV